MTQSAVRTDANTVTVTVTGTPTAASTAQIAVTIPAASLVASSTNLTVAANPSAVFNTTVVAPTRTLTTNLHGGTGGPAFPATIPQTAWTITPTTPVPTRANHTFVGWALTSGGVAVTLVPAGTTAVTLHALWTQNNQGNNNQGNNNQGGGSGNQGNQDQDNRTHAQNPRITQHPQDITVVVGEDTTLSITANVTDGGTLTFQWYRATGASGGRFVAIQGATNRTFSPNTSNIGVNRYRVVVTNTNNAASISGNTTARTTSQTATVTVGPNLPNVRVELSQGLAAELRTLLGNRFSDLDINILTSASSASNTYVVADISFQVDDGELNYALNSQLPSILQGANAYYTIFVELSGFVGDGVNYHRIVALQNGVIVGGGMSNRGMVFSVNVSTTGPFAISYVQNLRRLTLSLSSFTITDLAGNVPTQTMDVLPVIQGGRTLVPIRFIAEALGTEVDWTRAAADRPITIHLTRNGQTLSFDIGEITPQLAALGMDVPAQLINGRTMVPLRFIAEFFGAVVDWDGDTRGIEIIAPGEPPR